MCFTAFRPTPHLSQSNHCETTTAPIRVVNSSLLWPASYDDTSQVFLLSRLCLCSAVSISFTVQPSTFRLTVVCTSAAFTFLWFEVMSLCHDSAAFAFFFSLQELVFVWLVSLLPFVMSDATWKPQTKGEGGCSSDWGLFVGLRRSVHQIGHLFQGAVPKVSHCRAFHG